ncbi:MAG: cyclic nucleotide-binding domain-containing protein [Balneolaceae bacterium]|nr:cyclic nucleotide-binding domain-containing protein [Balneolaceae bacterium]
MFKKSDFKKIKDQSGIVFNSKMLKGLSPLERYELLQLCHRRKYKEGEFIYYQNDPGTGMYFIEEGSVKLTVTNPAEQNKNGEFSLDIHAPSEFGTMSIGYDIRRLSSAQCLTDCTLLGFFKPDFETLKKRHPETAVKFLEAVSTQAMKQLEQTMRKLTETIGLETAFSILLESQYQSGNEPEQI